MLFVKRVKSYVRPVVLITVFLALCCSLPVELFASTEQTFKEVLNNLKPPVSEMIEEVYEYPPIFDPDMPLEKAISEGKAVFIKEVILKPKNSKDTINSEVEPELSPEEEQTFQFPDIDNLYENKDTGETDSNNAYGKTFCIDNELIIEIVDQAKDTADQSEETVDQSKESVNQSEETVDQSEETIDQAEGTVDQSNEPADQAEGTVDQSNETADQAEGSIDQSNETADQAEGSIDQSNETADQAEGSVDQSNETADQAEGTVDQSNETADQAEGTVDQSNETVDNEKQKMDFPVRNKSGLYGAAFSLMPDKKLLRFTYTGASLLIRPLEAAPVTGKVSKNTITYEEIFPGTDFRYTVEDKCLKEDISVKYFTGQSDFYFELTVDNAVYNKNNSGGMDFLDPGSDLPLFHMAKPFAVDNKGSRCELVDFEITSEGLLRLTVDPEWLKTAEYPLIIDPTIYLPDSEGGGSGVVSYWHYTNTSLGGGWEVSANTCNLNLILSKSLFLIPGRGVPIGETMTYNSLDSRSGILGPGWRLGAESRVNEQADGSVIYTQGDGATHRFTTDNTGGYIAPPGVYLKLQKDNPENFKITDMDFNVYTYQNNKPAQIVDRNNNTTTFVYDANGRISKLTDPSGRNITYSYNPAGQLAAITNPAGLAYQFSYRNGQLVTVTDPDNNIFALSYDANNHLSAFTDPLGRSSSFAIGSNGKIQSYNDARTVGQDIYKTSFSQTAGGEVVTTVTDPGSITSTYYHNPDTGNLTKFQDMPGNTWTYTWSNNNLVSTADINGSTTYEYDSRGNVTKETQTITSDPKKNIVKTMTYDDYNQLLEVTDGEGRKKSYKYDVRGNMLSTSNPEIKESNGKKYDQYGNIVESSPKVSASYNVIMDGSFESWNYEPLKYWTRVGGSAAITSEGFQSHGQKALKISSSTPVTDLFKQKALGVTPYDYLTLRADVKLENVQSSSSAGGAVIRIKYKDYTYSYFCTGTGTVPLVLTVNSPDWNPDIYVGLDNASGTVSFDGVQLERSYRSYGYNLSEFNVVENSSFEDDLAMWNDNNNSATTEAAWGGQYSALLAITSSSGRKSITQDVPVYGGEPLVLSGMVKTENVTGKGAYLYINYYDNNSRILSRVETGYVTGTQDFTRIMCKATAPAGAVKGHMVAMLEGKGKAYFDSIKLVPYNGEKYTYNAAGNYVVSSQDALGKQIYRTYNESIGTQLSFKDALNNTTYYAYDNLNRLVRVTDPLSRKAYYQFDDANNLTDTRDPRSAGSADNTYRTQYIPNRINQLDTLTDQINRNTFNTYDRSGRLIKTKLPNGREIIYSYDNAHRMTGKDLGGGNRYSYTYDGANNLISVTDQDNKTMSWTYDGAGRITGSNNTFNNQLTYRWDKSYNLTLIINSKTGNTFYHYRDNNQLSEVNPPPGKVSYHYDESGRLFRMVYPTDYGSIQKNISYYPNGWVKQIQAGRISDGYFYNYSYYDNGNISSITSSTGNENFSYDANGRLTSWYYNNNGNINQESYQYDYAGNLLTKGINRFSYNNANQITNSGFTYDNNGNLTCDKTFTYVYDTENRLTQVRKVSDNTLVAEYTYNYNGLRKSKTVNGVTTNFHWDDFGNLICETDSSGAAIAKYYYDTNGGLIASYKPDVGYYYVHTNLRGDVTALYIKTLKAQYHYDPWGKQIYSSGTINQPFRYAGYYHLLFKSH